jgi:DNA-binding NarL/FixJ family response regulator
MMSGDSILTPSYGQAGGIIVGTAAYGPRVSAGRVRVPVGAAAAVYIDPSVAGKLLSQLAPPRSQLAHGLVRTLSALELDILRLVACGRSTARIAERLHLSDGIVRNTVSAILAKLQVSDRTQAALLAVQHGLGDAQS